MARHFKEVEKRLAEWLGRGVLKATRQSNTRMGEAVEDIHFGPFSVEVKSRAEVPEYVKNWMNQARKNAGECLPVVLWHEDHQRLGHQLAVMRLEDWWAVVEAFAQLQREQGPAAVSSWMLERILEVRSGVYGQVGD